MTDSPAPKPTLFDRCVGAIADLGSALAGLALLVALVLVAYSVVLRYAFNHPQSWVDEIVGYLLVATVMLAAGDALRRGEHIAVDVVTEKLGVRGKKIAFVAGLVAVALTAAIYIFDGWSTVAFSRMTGIVSTGTLETPVWIPQLLIPLGGAALLIAAIAALGRVAAGRDAFPPPPPDEVVDALDLSGDAPKPRQPTDRE